MDREDFFEFYDHLRLPKRFQHELFYYISLQFSILHSYREDTMESLNDAKKKKEKTITELIKLFPFDETEIKNSFKGTLRNYNETYIQLLRTTATTMCYSILEVCLTKICALAKERFQLPLKIKNINAQNDLEKFYIYLKNVAGLNLDNLAPEWREINQGRIVRNFIVHNHSNVIKEDAKAIDKQNHFMELSNIMFIEIDMKTGDIIIEDDTFINSFVNSCHIFCRDVLFKILAKRKVSKRKINEK